MKTLKDYLRDNDLENLYIIFKKAGVDELSLLAKLRYSDLEKMGIQNLIDRRKVFDIINEINQDMYTEEISFKNEVKPAMFDEKIDAANMTFTLTDSIFNTPGFHNVFDKNIKEYKMRENVFNFNEDIRNLSFDKPSGQIADLNETKNQKKFTAEGGEPISTEYDSGILKEEKIIVCVRKRPCENPEKDIINCTENVIVVNEPKLKIDLEPYTEQHKFSYDCVFSEKESNQTVYNKSVKDVVNHVKNGGFGSVIAYGQTGTGKTYTMLENQTGMIHLALKELTQVKKQGKITFCEIYMGQVYDLLNNGEKIILREANGVVHLTKSKAIPFETYNEVCNIIDTGLSLRKTGTTGANTQSSRSHAIVLVDFVGEGEFGSFVFVDLAGSERGSDRKGFSNDIKNEGAEINKSLLALKECIRGIEKDKKHLPFRQSKLTQILKNSFVGSSKLCLIATVSPSYENAEHTLNTLRYAGRIKEGYCLDKTISIPNTPTNKSKNFNEHCKEGIQNTLTSKPKNFKEHYLEKSISAQTSKLKVTNQNIKDVHSPNKTISLPLNKPKLPTEKIVTPTKNNIKINLEEKKAETINKIKIIALEIAKSVEDIHNLKDMEKILLQCEDMVRNMKIMKNKKI